MRLLLLLHASTVTIALRSSSHLLCCVTCALTAVATLATSYYRSEVVLNDCRREYVQRSYKEEVKERSAAWAARKQAVQANADHAQHTHPASPSSHTPPAHHSTTVATSISPKDTQPAEVTVLKVEKH